MLKPTIRDIFIVIGTLILAMSSYWVYMITTDNPILKAQYYEQAYNQGQQDFVAYMVKKVEDRILLSTGKIILFKVIQPTQ